MPERWLTGDPAAAKQAKVCFMGFGEGARACPGSRFALTEAKVALLRIYSAFTLQLAPYQVTMPDTRSLFLRVAPSHRHLHVLRPSPCSATVPVIRRRQSRKRVLHCNAGAPPLASQHHHECKEWGPGPAYGTMLARQSLQYLLNNLRCFC